MEVLCPACNKEIEYYPESPYEYYCKFCSFDYGNYYRSHYKKEEK